MTSKAPKAAKASKKKASSSLDEELALKAKKALLESGAKKKSSRPVLSKKAPAKGVVIGETTKTPAATSSPTTGKAPSSGEGAAAVIREPSKPQMPASVPPSTSARSDLPEYILISSDSIESSEAPELSLAGHPMPPKYIQNMLQSAYKMAYKVDEAEYKRLTTMPAHMFLESLLSSVFMHTMVAKERAGDKERGFAARTDVEGMKEHFSRHVAQVTAKYKQELEAKEGDNRRLAAQITESQGNLTRAAVKIEDLEKQADGLAASNMALASDKIALKTKLQESLRFLDEKEQKEKDLQSRLAQLEKEVADGVEEKKELEEKTVNGFIKGYHYAQGELVKRDPEFDGSWMSLGFDREARLGGEEEEDEEEEEGGGEEEEEGGGEPVGIQGANNEGTAAETAAEAVTVAGEKDGASEAFTGADNSGGAA